MWSVLHIIVQPIIIVLILSVIQYEETINIITTCIQWMGRVLFLQVFVCPHMVEGLPHLHSTILLLVPCTFCWVPSDWSQVPSEGHPSPRWGVTLVPGGGVPQCQMGYLHLGVLPLARIWLGYYPSQDSVPPGQDSCSPLSRTGLGNPLPPETKH